MKATEKILSRLGGTFDVGLTAKQYEAILNDKIFTPRTLELEAGTYTIDLVVKDRLSGKVAARREKLVLPSTDSDFAATAAVLSRHAETAWANRIQRCDDRRQRTNSPFAKSWNFTRAIT